MRAGCSGLLVTDLSVNNRREATLCIMPNAIPHVQDGPTRCIYDGASRSRNLVESRQREAECRHNHHVAFRKRPYWNAIVAEKPDTGRSESVVHLWIVDDLTSEKHSLIRKASSSLVGVIYSSIYAIAESESLGQIDRQTSDDMSIVRRSDIVDQGASIKLGQLFRHLMLQAKPATEDDGRRAIHMQSPDLTRMRRLRSSTLRHTVCSQVECSCPGNPRNSGDSPSARPRVTCATVDTGYSTETAALSFPERSDRDRCGTVCRPCGHDTDKGDNGRLDTSRPGARDRRAPCR